MSKPLRESFDALVDDIYDDLVATIGADRHMKDYKVKTLLDQGLFTAAAAQKAGLIDDVLYADQVQDAIKTALKTEDVEIVTDYKKKRIDTDFSGISGMMKLLELFMGGKPSEAEGKKQKIAVVYAVGPIMEGKSQNDFFGDDDHRFDHDRRGLEESGRRRQGGRRRVADRQPRRLGRGQRPDLAGNGPHPSQETGDGQHERRGRQRRLLHRHGRKKIIAAPGTLTGSIGVIGGKLVVRGLYDKLGMNTEVISRGANSGSLSPTQPFTPDERKAWTELLQETYHQFVDKAASGRKMSYDKLEQMAQGRVYTGRMAQKLGLIDELGTLQDAIAAAKTAAGLKADAEVDLMVLPEPKSIFEQLFGDPSASTDFDSLLPEGFKIFQQTKLLRQMLSQRILLWMPYGVEVKVDTHSPFL